MKLNRKWLLAIALVLSLTMAISGTLAYLTDRDTVENTFTMGNVNIEVEENFDQNSPLNPGVSVTKEAGIKNTHATEPAYVWMVVSVPNDLASYIELDWAGSYEASTVTSPHDGYTGYLVKYPTTLAAGDSTGNILESVKLAANVDYQNGQYVAVSNGQMTPIGDLSNVSIMVDGFAIQTEGFDNVDAAYAAYTSQWGSSAPDGGNDNKVTVDASDIENTDFTAPNQTFELTGEFENVEIIDLGDGSVLSFDDAIVGNLTITDDAVLEGTATIDSVNVVRNGADPITVTLREANLDVANEINVKNTDGKSVLNIENSNINAGTIFVGEHTNNSPTAQAELNITNSYVSCEEASLGSTIAVWGQSGVDAKIYDSEIYTYSRGWHQSEDANDNSITFQGAGNINVDIQRSNMHLYGARSIINVRKYGSADATIDAKIDESLIWVVTKSNHGDETLPVWGFNEITDSMLLFTKDNNAEQPVFKSFVYGNPVVHGDYHVTTQCKCDADIALADGQTVTFASDANVSIYDGAGNVEFVKNGSAKVVLESGASVTNIGGLD